MRPQRLFPIVLKNCEYPYGIEEALKEKGLGHLLESDLTGKLSIMYWRDKGVCNVVINMSPIVLELLKIQRRRGRNLLPCERQMLHDSIAL